MNLKSKPQGYISAFPSHTDPVYANPPPKLIEQKEQETLLGANLKSFIKERLFGNFINYTKFYNQRKFNFTPSITSLTELNEVEDSHPMRSSPSIQQGYKHRISELRSNMQKKINERYIEKRVEKGNNSNRLSQRRSIEQSAILNSQRTKINSSSRSNKYSLQSSHIEKKSSYDFQKYPASSFISAIQEHFEQPKKQSSGRKQAKLTPLQNKAELISKLEKVKERLNSSSHLKRKNPNRIQTEKYQISENVFELFCQPAKKIDKLNNNNLQNESTILSNGKHSIDTKTIQANKSSLSNQKAKPFPTRTHFVKEIFLQYINSRKQTYPPMALLFYSFFQLNSKIYDQLKIEQYKVIVESMVSSSPRVWAVSSFRFWDCNQDGIICSKDIFALYQIFDSFQARLKEEDKFQHSKGYKILVKLKSILSQLSSIITQINFDKQLQKKKQVSENINEDKFEMKYLQEALLRKKEVRYSDLVLILGHNMKNAAKDTKKSVFQTGKELSMKYSSCYRYSFIATDHNEQTREDRQQIEMLKQELKKQKMELVEKQSVEGLQKDKIMGINYKTYYQKELFVGVKGMVLDIFAIQLL